MYNYSQTLENLGRSAEAEPVARDCLVWYREALGPQHPDTVDAAALLAGILRGLGSNEEAAGLEEECAALRP